MTRMRLCPGSGFLLESGIPKSEVSLEGCSWAGEGFPARLWSGQILNGGWLIDCIFSIGWWTEHRFLGDLAFQGGVFFLELFNLSYFIYLNIYSKIYC